VVRRNLIASQLSPPMDSANHYWSKVAPLGTIFRIIGSLPTPREAPQAGFGVRKASKNRMRNATSNHANVTQKCGRPPCVWYQNTTPE